SSRRRHTIFSRDWSSDVCSSDLINEEEPRLDARLPNGYRIHAVIPPCSRKGTTVAIRKFATVQFTFKDYVRINAMTADAAQFLRSEEHTSELQSRENLVCRLLLE